MQLHNETRAAQKHHGSQLTIVGDSYQGEQLVHKPYAYPFGHKIRILVSFTTKQHYIKLAGSFLQIKVAVYLWDF